MSAPILPAEIWLHIFGHFCPHCGSKDMPDFSPPSIKQEDFDYESGKSALADLSLTSRHMRELSQPVLYHCFYDHPYRNNMSKFLRTLISQPRLALCVRVLSLPENKDGHFEYHTRDEVEAWNKVSKKISLSPPRWISGLLSGDAPAESVAFDRSDSRLQYLSATPKPYVCALRSWQHCLTVGLCSTSLTHLAMFDMHGPCHDSERFLEDSPGPSQPPERPFNFPNLRVFSCFKDLFLEEFSSFLSQAPLLVSVAASGIIWPRVDSGGWVPPKLLSSLRSLSFCCNSEYFREIIGACEHVEDLEISILAPPWDPWYYDPSREPILDPWPAFLKTQVRRLCWDANDFEGFLFMTGEGQNFVPPVRDFQNLDILEIDRMSLYAYVEQGLSSDTPTDEQRRQLPSFLPPSIRILHVSSESCLGLTWSMMIIELEALAAAKKTTLQKLSVIQADLNENQWHQTGLPGFMEKIGVINALRDVGIELKFGQERKHLRRGRGMIPPLPGNLEYLGNSEDDGHKFSVNHFALED